MLNILKQMHLFWEITVKSNLEVSMLFKIITFSSSNNEELYLAIKPQKGTILYATSTSTKHDPHVHHHYPPPNTPLLSITIPKYNPFTLT